MDSMESSSSRTTGVGATTSSSASYASSSVGSRKAHIEESLASTGVARRARLAELRRRIDKAKDDTEFGTIKTELTQFRRDVESIKTEITNTNKAKLQRASNRQRLQLLRGALRLRYLTLSFPD